MKLTFTAKVQKIMRVAIPRTIYESLSIKEGDLVEINIKKIKEEKRIFPPRE